MCRRRCLPYTCRCDSLHWSQRSKKINKNEEERRICQHRVPILSSMWMHMVVANVFWLVLNCPQSRNVADVYLDAEHKVFVQWDKYIFASQRRCSWVRRKKTVIFISANCLVNRPGCLDGCGERRNWNSIYFFASHQTPSSSSVDIRQANLMNGRVIFMWK